MIKLVTHDRCNQCPMFEAKSISEIDHKVEGCTIHYVSCIHHVVCANMESRIRDELKSLEKKEKEDG